MRCETIGAATLYLGDCRDVLPTLGKVDAVVTDPPYGIGIAANPVRQKHAKAAWDNAPPDGALFDVLRSMSDLQIIWGGNYFDLPPAQGFFVWDKGQPESFSLSMCEQAWTNIKTPAKMFRRRVVSFKKEHPTQKPDDLMRWCIGYLPAKAALILDPFMGSGTTGVAAIQTGKQFIGVERDESYFDLACRRIEEAQRQLDLFIEPASAA